MKLLDHRVVLFLIFWKLSNTALQSDCINLNSYQQCMSIPFSSHPHQSLLFVEFLIIVIWQVWDDIINVIFVSISLIISDVVHLFICLLGICRCLFGEKMFIQILFSLFKLGCFLHITFVNFSLFFYFNICFMHLGAPMMGIYTHTHTHTHIYIYIYMYSHYIFFNWYFYHCSMSLFVSCYNLF